MKVLVSRGYGAGWSTWNDKMKEVATYAPIIEFIEQGHSPGLLEGGDTTHLLVRQMMRDLELGSFYTGGACGLCVQEVDGPFYIEEYDGAERVVTEEDFW